MDNKYNDYIKITRSGERTLNIDVTASAEVVEQSIIALFDAFYKISDTAALCLASKLIDIAARKES